MPAPLKKWTVLPHQRLTAVEDNILTVVGSLKMPLTEIERRMTVVRLRNGGLVIFSAIALDPGEMREIEDFGTLSYLVVPNDWHRMDAKIWKDRYPALKVITPEGSRERVSEVVHVDATAADFGDPSVRLLTVPGTRGHEAALEITGSAGMTLVLNDIIANIQHPEGFDGWVLRIMGFAGDEPQMPKTIKTFLVKDKADLAAQLRRWAALPLKRILVSHGDAIEDDPADALLKLAGRLE